MRIRSNEFQGRRWLHALLDELIFVSSYEQSPTAIASTQRIFQNHPGLRIIGSSLENLQYYRLNHEFNQIRHFTGALEQLQIADLLGEALLN